MAQRKSSRGRGGASAAEQAGNAVSDSAQKIWLAGLGAYERAKSEGPKMFEVLVEQGRTLGGKARDAADEALKRVRDGASGAGGRFDKLEKVLGDLTDNVRELVRQAGSGAKSTRASKRGPASKRRGAAKAGSVKRKAKSAVRKAKRKASRAKA